MKRLIFLCLSACVLLLAQSCAEAPEINIVPYPNDITVVEGSFNAKGAAVTYDESLDEATINIIETFAQKLSFVSGAQNAVSAGVSDKGFVFVYNGQVPFEAYVLEVTPEVARVEASGLRGFNHAIQTLRQLLPVEVLGDEPAPRAEWVIPALRINDAPRFAYRGLHLDVGRHFFDVEEVKRCLDIMELHKLNTFHWHLTEDQGWRIEIKKYPLLTEIGSKRKGTCIRQEWDNLDGIPYGGYYTQDEIREVVAYAASKGITVIPEIDLPGHMLGALAAYPELGCTGGPYEVWTRWGVSHDVLCAGNEKIYEFLEDVFSEVCDLFPSEYIHIGGDECRKSVWEKCPKCQAKIKALGLKDKDGESAEHYLQSYVITRIEKFLNGKGRKIIGWDEILEGGIAPNATIMSWHGDKPGWKAAAMGHNAIMTPNYCMYFNRYHSKDHSNEPYANGGFLPVEKIYAYEPCFEGMSEDEQAHILGVQANIWTEYIPSEDNLYYMLLPRLAALSEVQWCCKDRKDWDRFYDASEDYCRMYKTMGYNYAEHIFHAKGEVQVDPETKSATVELWAQDDAPVRYTLDGTAPTRFSKKYEGPLTLTESFKLRAVAFRKGVAPREYTCSFVSHKAIGAELTYSARPYRKYRNGFPGCLTDGLRGIESFKNASWSAWREKPVDLTIDMKKETVVNSVAAGILLDQTSNIFLPESLAVSVSIDGENFTQVASQKYDAEAQAENFLGELTLDFPETPARYVRLSVVPLAKIPSWRDPQGGSAYVFVDEIIIK